MIMHVIKRVESRNDLLRTHINIRRGYEDETKRWSSLAHVEEWEIDCDESKVVEIVAIYLRGKRIYERE